MHCQHLIHCTSEKYIPTCLCVSLCSDAFATPQPNISLALPMIIHHGPSFHGSEFCCWHSTAWTKCIFVWAVHSTHVQSLSTSAFQPPVLRPWHQWEDQGDGPWVWCWVSSTPHNWSFSACPKTFTIAEGSKANAVEEKIIEIGSYVIQQYWTYIIYIYTLYNEVFNVLQRHAGCFLFKGNWLCAEGAKYWHLKRPVQTKTREGNKGMPFICIFTLIPDSYPLLEIPIV